LERINFHGANSNKYGIYSAIFRPFNVLALCGKFLPLRRYSDTVENGHRAYQHVSDENTTEVLVVGVPQAGAAVLVI